MPSEPRPGPVVLTREPADNRGLAALVEARGWGWLEWPAQATEALEPPDGVEALRARMSEARWVLFTSRRGVARAAELGLTATLRDAALAAAGPATGAALAELLGRQPELTAEGRGWRELADAVLATTETGDRLLLVRNAAADRRLPDALEAAGRVVDDVRLHGPGEPEAVREPEQPVAAFVTASPTAARRILEWNPWARDCPFVSIGPTTTEALRDELGVRRVVEASAPTDEEMLAALLEATGRTETR